jgi:hypothetical protein
MMPGPFEDPHDSRGNRPIDPIPVICVGTSRPFFDHLVNGSSCIPARRIVGWGAVTFGEAEEMQEEHGLVDSIFRGQAYQCWAKSIEF